MALLIILRPQRNRKRLLLELSALATVALLSLTPWAAELVKMIMMSGPTEDFNVLYRQRLLDISFDVIKMNPWFGSHDFTSLPIMQQLIQGEGIIDVVNSYLQVALAYGLVGLTLFCGVFFASVRFALVVNKSKYSRIERNPLLPTILACLGAILLTISSVSGIANVPIMYWVVAGLCVAHGRLAQEQAVAKNTLATRTDRPSVEQEVYGLRARTKMQPVRVKR
jgi:O-antigen ligase